MRPSFRPFAAVIAALFLQAAPAGADDVPAGRQAVYRISVERTWTTTGVAVSGDGTVLTSASVLSHCPPEGECRIWVEAPEDGRDVWHRATVAATDATTGVVALRIAARLPGVGRLVARSARPGEPVHAYAYDGNDVRFLVGNVRGVRSVRYPSQPEGATSSALLSTMPCPDGSAGAGVFAVSDEGLVGLVFGPVDDDDGSGLSAAVPSTTIRAFLDAHRISYDRPRPQRARR